MPRVPADEAPRWSSKTNPRRQKRANGTSKFIGPAVACLKQAIAAQCNNFEDTDLTALRGLPEFEALFPKKRE